MRSAIFKTLLSGVLLICGNAAFSQTPLEFNNKLAAITDTLYAKGMAWGTKFNEAVTTKDFSKLIAFRTDMENFINAKIEEVKKMKDVGGSKDMQKGIIDFLFFEKEMLRSGFLPIEKLNGSSTDAEIKTAFDNLTMLSKGEAEKLANYNKVQEEYARRNGFTIGKGQ